MIHAVKTQAGLPYSVVWFPDEPDVPAVTRLRMPVTVIRQGSAAFMRAFDRPLLRCVRFCTAVTDLTQPEEQLLASMHKSCRAAVRHALNSAHTFEALRPSEAPEARRLIDDFNRTLYGRPVSAANWRLTERHGVLTQLRVEGVLIAANTHLLDGTLRARALHGATIPRDGRVPARVIADSNRLLTWYDMLYARSLGIRTYDAGGLFDDPAHPSVGVDRFKLAFGYTPHYEYHAVTTPYAVARHGLGRLAGNA